MNGPRDWNEIPEDGEDIDQGAYSDYLYELERDRKDEEAYQKACEQAGADIKEASLDPNNPWHMIANDERKHPVTGSHKPLSEAEFNETIRNIGAEKNARKENEQ